MKWEESGFEESALPMALIGVNIWHLKFFFSAVSRQPEEAFLSLSTSTLILTDLENTVKNKRLILFSLLHFQTCAAEVKRRRLNSAACTTNDTFGATAAKELAIKSSAVKHNILPPSAGESDLISHICIVLLPPLSLIQRHALSCCQPWACESMLATPLSTFHGLLQRGEKH